MELLKQIIIDGEDVTIRCREAVTGDDGRVLLYVTENENFVICGCTRLVMEIRKGKVEAILK